MSSVYDEMRLVTPNIPLRIWKGIIASNPSSFSDLVDIVIPNFDESRRWQGIKWQSRNDIDLPGRGDECLVIFSDEMEPWVVAWWPFS